MNILVIDETCPKPYDHTTLHTTSQGGTESTVTRVAEALGARGHRVCVWQKPRNTVSISDTGVEYAPILGTGQFDRALALRLPRLLPEALLRAPKTYLWAHDLFTEGSAQETQLALQTTGSKLICVSEYHARQSGIEGAKVLYNPCDPILPYLKSSTTNPFQLIWYSSPHKGLQYALRLFAALHKQDSRFRFIVYNPGYLPTQETTQPGVEYRKGSYLDCLRDVAQSLCVFYPNLIFPETFGLVFAEANALGVPVLTHDLGAAREVLDHPSEIINCRDVGAVIRRVLEWSAGGRPIIKGSPRFNIDRITSKLEAILRE